MSVNRASHTKQYSSFFLAWFINVVTYRRITSYTKMLLQMDYLKHFFLGFYKSYLYPVIPVALYTSLLYAVSLFIMKSVHCFGKKTGKLEHVLSLIQRVFGKSIQNISRNSPNFYL